LNFKLFPYGAITTDQQGYRSIEGDTKDGGRKEDCGDILQQVSAVKKAIDALSKEIVVTNICEFLPHKDVEKVSRMIERAIIYEYVSSRAPTRIHGRELLL